ncbi:MULTISPECIES: hypothetical protein [Okeania]|uniref:Uncharacterized protein n=1 Tax=Okeania hirsuta TaxID=1458930 RepID=A0A3N6P8B6_9CYAN|nr:MULTISPECIES: hypothetical protein [Okeania]NEQ76599.1 hypothetical protein [Okeania sp. SIO2C9]NES77142.1 hypothetical protein [Okeania sp. SIO1H4]NET20768.1 hypothetical protein [Okeania sp. SIO1H5]NET94383.1 hypothetical protein [Okeania sp. SIO1H2]RQH21835.1 hypothetical protein D4Z78_08845 [Okeania hirsuta]
MYNKNDLILSILTLIVVVTMGLPTIEINNNLVERYSDELGEEIFHHFVSSSDEDPPVPYKEGTTRG